MPNRSSNNLNQAGFTEGQMGSKDDVPQKNPAAVALGRLGGLKGGKARAEKLSTEERQSIARNAAMTRWKRRPS